MVSVIVLIGVKPLGKIGGKGVGFGGRSVVIPPVVE